MFLVPCVSLKDTNSKIFNTFPPSWQQLRAQFQAIELWFRTLICVVTIRGIALLTKVFQLVGHLSDLLSYRAV